MQIRSVTFFADPQDLPHNLEQAVADARAAFTFPVQTIRLATTPYPDWLNDISGLDRLVGCCREFGVDYMAVGPARLDDDPHYVDWIPDLVGDHEMVFASAEVADLGGRIGLQRVNQVAEVVGRLATLRPDGFANLYFTATANCPPGSPFFPVAYHGGGPAGFALAVEAADVALAAIDGASDLHEAEETLIGAIEQNSAGLARVASQLATRHHLAFGGIDYSLAPHPMPGRSLGAAVERMGVSHVGASGSLFAAAWLASCVDRAQFPRCGFSGLMFPVLEDAVLARRASEGLLTLDDLLLYSAVCGAGLDVLPLPGNIASEVLSAILLDLAALAVRLDKPLTARLMPLPGLSVGDPVDFDFGYFAQGGVMAAGGGLEGRLTAGLETVRLAPRSAGAGAHP
jgi:hypothetical protein